MVHALQTISLLFCITVAITSGKQTGKRSSRLILEYDWPEPKKNLQRFPHGVSCSHFYLIRPDGSQTIKKCPENQLFDFRSLQCRVKGSAKCWGDLLKKGNLKKVKKHFRCPFPWGLYPDIEDCSMFYDCLNGKSYPRKCPESTLFDKVERTCVEESAAMCADQSDVVERDFKCPYKWGFFTYSKDCSKYYECLGKVPSLRTCKKNMLFDNFKRKCLAMSNVECGERFNPYGSERVTTELMLTERERVRTEVIPTRRDRERIPTGYEQVTDDNISKGSERVRSESIITDEERLTTEHIPISHERVTTEHIPISREWVSTERIPISRERVSTERIPISRERVSTERIPVSRERVTTENIPTERERVTSKRPVLLISTGQERMTYEQRSTEGERMTTKRIPTGHEWVTNERTPTGHEWATSERIHTGSEWVTNERIPTGDEWVSNERINTGRERVTTDRIPTGRERVISDRIPTSRERVTTDRIPTGHERVTTEQRIPTVYESVTNEPISIDRKQVANENFLNEDHIFTGMM